MDLIYELRNRFSSGFDNRSWQIINLPDEYPAVIVSGSGYYGVAILNSFNKEINQNLSKVKIFNDILTINGYENNYLLLVSFDKFAKNEFATLCTQFILPGFLGNDREELLQNPIKWWENWKNLVGNRTIDKESYSVIAELLVLKEIYLKDNSVSWGELSYSTHDLESLTKSYEVKSTLQKYSDIINISSENQLIGELPVELFLCRMEKSTNGYSVNSLKEELVNLGYDGNDIEGKLLKLDFNVGSIERKEKFSCIEMRRYIVDEKFPKITDESFKNGIKPSGVKQIGYKISLEGILYTKVI